MESANVFADLRGHAARLQSTSLATLVASDPARAVDFSLRVGPLHASFARQKYDRPAFAALIEAARRAAVPAAFRRLFDGEAVNTTEQRPALHTALRGDLSPTPVARAAHGEVLAALESMRRAIDALQDSDVTDIVSVGIGGSDLGPRLAVDALSGPLPGRFRVHFISNVDGAAAQRTLAPLDPARAADFSLRVGPLHASFARQKYDRPAFAGLIEAACRAGVPAAFRRLFDGEAVNTTEQRPALHTALRGDLSPTPVARAAHGEALAALESMRRAIDALQDSDVTDIVSVGIGGSDLGPRLAVDALSGPLPGRFRVHFISNVDGAAAQRTLAPLDPARTAAILVSKSFGTQETLLNGAILRDWLGNDARLHAVSANVERAAAFGIDPSRVLPMWDWVGGRYSLWSAVGLPIALAIGMGGFEQLLAGAAEMDAHVLEAAPERNLAVWHGMTAVWNRNALGLASQGVFAYDQRLRLLPAHLQQLVMESLGKSVRIDGMPVRQPTVPVWWGGAGTDVQHSFFQALHQGTEVVPADFVGVVRPDHPHLENHRALLANLLAQTEALANGVDSSDAHQCYPGGRPSTVMLLDALTPRALGALVALYEHSVYVQSVLWQVNAFDQFGVELGKTVANRLLPSLRGQAGDIADPVTAALLDEIRSDR